MVAIVATNCEAWSEAAELWLDVALQPAAGAAAALCAAEGALRSGDFGLADQMITRSPGAGEARARLDALIAELAPVRAARRELFTAMMQGVDAPPIERLVALALYRDAVRAVAYDDDLGEAATRSWLMRAHHGLGEHKLVIGLAPGAPLNPEFAPMVDHARAMVERRALPPEKHRARFVADHPAAGLIAWPGNP